MATIRSQTSSGIDAIPRHRSNTLTNPSSLSRARAAGPIANQDEINLALETFINSLQLNIYFQLSEAKKDERLAKIDALELFHALQTMDQRLAMDRLENYYLTDFLEKNDPKLLIGLAQRRATTAQQQQAIMRPRDATQSVSSSMGNRTRASISRSHITTTTGGSQKKSIYDYKLNFRAKTDIAEKLATELEKRVNELENSGMHFKSFVEYNQLFINSF